jgi:hypothetical protein
VPDTSTTNPNAQIDRLDEDLSDPPLLDPLLGLLLALGLVVDGESVRAFHYRLQRTLTGDQTGTEDTHEWYAATDGLLVRATRDTEVASPSPLGDVVDTELGEFRLASTTPRR